MNRTEPGIESILLADGDTVYAVPNRDNSTADFVRKGERCKPVAQAHSVDDVPVEQSHQRHAGAEAHESRSTDTMNVVSTTAQM